MLDYVRGTIVGIERHLQRLRIRLGLSDVDEYATYSDELTIWPMAEALFTRTQRGGYHCLGAIGIARPLMDEQFLVAAGAAWDFTTISAGTRAQGASIGLGVLELAAPNFDDANIDKTANAIVLPSAPAAIHGVCSLLAGDLYTTAISSMNVNIANIMVAHDPSLFGTVGVDPGNWGFLMSDDSGTQTVSSGTEVAEDDPVTVDLLALGTGFCGGWINGDGPYVIENLLATSAFSIGATNINGGSGATEQLYVGRIAASRVEPVLDPSRFALGFGAFASVT